MTIILSITMLSTVALFVGCNSDSPTSNGNSDSQAPKTFCQIVSEITGETVLTSEDAPYYFTIGSDDSYCEIDTNPFDLSDFSSDSALLYIEQMNKALGLPEYLFNNMLHTSYSQGKQTEEFKNFKVIYYYHPDKGLNVTYNRIYR